VQIVLATDADWIVDDVVAVLGGDGVSFIVCREGRVVSDQVAEHSPDLVITDLQIGSMGGMAVTMALRLDESSGAVPHAPVLMLLDRAADVHLARRTGADGWMIKPLNPLQLKRAASALIAGGTYPGEPPEPEADPVAEPDRAADDAAEDVADVADDVANPAEEEPATAG
jgi:DNA-binding response OmpR family regulator